MIHLEAVKCRYCREFLEDPDVLPASNHAKQQGPPGQSEEQDRTEPFGLPNVKVMTVLPSLWSMADSLWKGGCVLAVAVFVLALPIERWVLVFKGLQDSTVQGMARIINTMAMAVIGVVLVWLGLRAAYLKGIHYAVSPDRIEWTRGLFSRKIDNIDMFRVIDIKLHRSILDCVTGVGTITVMTKDETDPTFRFEKVRNPRQVYDFIKRASLDADRRQGVIHIE